MAFFPTRATTFTRILTIRFVCKVVLALAVSTACAFSAQAQQRFELQPFVGYKYGGGADVAGNVLGIRRVNIDSSIAYGATLTFNPSEYMGFEFLWNRQPTNASGALYNGGTYSQKVGVTLDQFHGDFLFSLAGHGSKVEPFVLFGLGATDMHSSGSSTTKFSFGVGGGVKYFVSRHLGFRIQARYAPTYLYSTSSGIWCDWWGYCWTIPNDHFLHQGDVTTGLILRF
jgi:hypothetical protein